MRVSKARKIIEINPQSENVAAYRKMAPTVLTNVSPDMQIMQNEIFGPVLPILEYDQIDDVIEFINSRPRPLCFILFRL